MHGVEGFTEIQFQNNRGDAALVATLNQLGSISKIVRNVPSANKTRLIDGHQGRHEGLDPSSEHFA
jgi:hypothetical protein